MKTHPAPVNQKQALALALKPYRRYKDWIKSPDCFLSTEEIGLVSLYGQTGSYHICCGLLQKSIIEVAGMLIKTILRLKTGLFLYQQWQRRQAYLDRITAGQRRRVKRRLRQKARPQRPVPTYPP